MVSYYTGYKCVTVRLVYISQGPRLTRMFDFENDQSEKTRGSSWPRNDEFPSYLAVKIALVFQGSVIISHMENEWEGLVLCSPQHYSYPSLMELFLFSTSKVSCNCHFKMCLEIINVGLCGPPISSQILGSKGCCGSEEVAQLILPTPPKIVFTFSIREMGHRAHMPPYLIQLVGVVHLKPWTQSSNGLEGDKTWMWTSFFSHSSSFRKIVRKVIDLDFKHYAELCCGHCFSMKGSSVCN